MKLVFSILLMLSIIPAAYTQRLDLIVKSDGDSIACRIDSITDTKIYFEMIFRNNWILTETNISECIGYKRNAVSRDSVVFKPGTSYIMPKGEQPDSGIYVRNFRKNTIYGTLGFIGLYGAISGNFERLIWEPRKGLFKSIWLRVGGGGWYSWEVSGTHIVSSLTMLTGLRNSHIEFDLGLASQYDKSSYEIEVRNSYIIGREAPSKSEYRDTYPSIGLGYRYQKPDGHFLFRTGLALPESAYISLGFCF